MYSNFITVVGRGGTEYNISAEVVFSPFAVITLATRHTGFNRNAITGLQAGYIISTTNYNTSGFVSDDHRRGYNKVTNTSVSPVVDIGSTDTNLGHADKYL